MYICSGISCDSKQKSTKTGVRHNRRRTRNGSRQSNSPWTACWGSWDRWMCFRGLLLHKHLPECHLECDHKHHPCLTLHPHLPCLSLYIPRLLLSQRHHYACHTHRILQDRHSTTVFQALAQAHSHRTNINHNSNVTARRTMMMERKLTGTCKE